MFYYGRDYSETVIVSVHIFFYLSPLYSFFHLKVILNRPKEGSQTFLRHSLCKKLWMCLFSMMFWGLKFLSSAEWDFSCIITSVHFFSNTRTLLSNAKQARTCMDHINYEELLWYCFWKHGNCSKIDNSNE